MAQQQNVLEKQMKKTLCDHLDELIKCPVCKEKWTGHIFICESGHNTCGTCTQKVFPCKICKKPYSSIRNTLAELLSLQVDAIKTFIMRTDVAVSKEKTASNDTKNPVVSGNSSKAVAKEPIRNGFRKVSNFGPRSDETWGRWTCWIDRRCFIVGSHSDIIEHMKKSHPHEFEEYPTAKLPYTQTWQMDYAVAHIFLNRVFKIANGVFLLHIRILENGEMRACVLMYANNRTASSYIYKIEIECDEKTVSFIGNVDCARVHKNFLTMGTKGIFIKSNDPVFNALKEKLHFTCTVTIERNNVAFIHGAVSHNQAELKQRMNRFNKRQGNNVKRLKADLGVQQKSYNRPKESHKNLDNKRSMSLITKFNALKLKTEVGDLSEVQQDHDQNRSLNLSNEPSTSGIPALMTLSLPSYQNHHDKLQKVLEDTSEKKFHSMFSNKSKVNTSSHLITDLGFDEEAGPKNSEDQILKDEISRQNNDFAAQIAQTLADWQTERKRKTEIDELKVQNNSAIRSEDETSKDNVTVPKIECPIS